MNLCFLSFIVLEIRDLLSHYTFTRTRYVFQLVVVRVFD